MEENTGLGVLTVAMPENSLPKNIGKKGDKNLVEWLISDPQGQPIEAVRLIRGQIKRKANLLAEQEKVGKAAVFLIFARAS